MASQLKGGRTTRGDDERGKKNLRKFEEKLVQPPSSYSLRSSWPTFYEGADCCDLLWWNLRVRMVALGDKLTMEGRKEELGNGG